MEVSPLSGAPAGTEGAESHPAEPAVQSSPRQPAGDAPGAAPGEASGDGDGQEQGRSPRAKRTASLPGVQLNDDGDPWIRADKRRDASGRFVSDHPQDQAIAEAESEDSTAPGEAPTKEQVKAAAPVKPALPIGVEPPKEGFRFAGQQYKTQAEAEQSHRSLQGMFRGMKDEIGHLKERNAQVEHAMNAWRAEAERRASGGGNPASEVPSQSGRGPAPSPAGNAPSGEDLLAGIDFNTFEGIAVQAGLPAAGKYLAENLMKVVTEKVLPGLRSEFGQSLAPVHQAQEQAAAAQAVDGAVSQLSSLELPSGGPAFPELSDPQSLHGIGVAWREVGGSLNDLMSANGLMRAIAVYRMSRGFTPPAPAQVAPPAAPASRPASPAAASIAPDSGGGARQIARGPARTPEHARLLRALENTNMVDRDLGFARNRADR